MYNISARTVIPGGGSATSGVARILVSAAGGPLADVEVTFLHNDAAGSPAAATNAAGAVKWSRGYQPYGEFSSQTGTASDTRQFFHGKPLNGESGFQYFAARRDGSTMVASSPDGTRVWRYGHVISPDGGPTYPFLAQVQRPDGRCWRFEYNLTAA